MAEIENDELIFSWLLHILSRDVVAAKAIHEAHRHLFDSILPLDDDLYRIPSAVFSLEKPRQVN